MISFADKVLGFYKSLQIKQKLPKGVGVLNPYQDKETFKLCESFYRKFYHDDCQRAIILGINPGRFGGGLTGIPFMDPVKLSEIGISNNFVKKVELSADFINNMILKFGGHEKFYGKFYINSVSPLGFIAEGKNLNYYDTPQLKSSIRTFVIDSLKKQIDFGVRTDIAFCLGEGDNFKFITQLNAEQKLFKEIIPLAHPRFIMQYKRKHIDTYIKDYLNKLSKAS